MDNAPPGGPIGSPIKHKVRTVTREGEPWFVLTDVCSVLEIGNPSMAASRLDEDEKADLSIADTSSSGVTQTRSVLIISESGLWSLVLTSRKPEAKAFKKWLTSVVIPSLRKHGGYVVGQETDSIWPRPMPASTGAIGRGMNGRRGPVGVPVVPVCIFN